MPAKPIIAVILACLSLAAVCSAATIYVPDDYAAIQDAIAASANGDAIIVRPGTYFENIDFMGRAVTVKSEAGPEATVIDGGKPVNPDFASVVTFMWGENRDSVLEGFTITNGWGTRIYWGSGSQIYGGGIYCTSGPTVRNNIITMNSARYGAGVACLEASGPLFTGNTITLNAGASSGGGFYAEESYAEVSGNTITMNSDNGIEFEDSFSAPEPSRIVGNLIAGNRSYGIDYDWAIGATIAFNTVRDNMYAGIKIAGDAEINDNTVVDNGGDGIYVSYGSATIRRCVVSGNVTDGIQCGEDSVITRCVVSDNGYTGIRIDSDSRPWILGCTIRGSANHSGIRLGSNCVLVMAGCSVLDNYSDWNGGGIDFDRNTSATIMSCLFAGNQADDAGGGISVYKADRIVVKNCTFTGNTAGLYGGGISVSQSAPEFTNCILWGNDAPDRPDVATPSGSLDATYCNIGGGWPGTGNIDADPLFVDFSGGDFHLTHDSPCRDTGNTAAVPAALETDFEEDPRIAGTVVDMGADEFFPHLYFTGTPQPGASIEIKVIGTPGAAPVRLLAGAGIRKPPASTPYGDLHLAWPITPTHLGTIPTNGVLAVTKPVPGGWIPGRKHPFQALIGALGSPDTTLTNLMEIAAE